MKGYTKDEAAGCWRQGPIELGASVVQHWAVCDNGTCRTLMALTIERISGEAREDIRVDSECKTAHTCRNRILGPLSDFKPHVRQ